MKTKQRYTAFLYLTLLCSLSLFGQNLPANQNYVKSTEYLTDTGESGGKKVNIMYLDGLGREKQAVSYQASPAHRDIIVQYKYDEYGRQTKEYLSAPTQQNSGVIVADPDAAYNSYYGTEYGTDVFFSQKELEASVLGRPLKQAAPGDEWELGSGKEIKFDYKYNSINEVKIYKAVTTWNTSAKLYDISIVQGTGFYNAKELYKTTTTDENGKPVIEFRNKTGQVILIRKFVTAGTSAKVPNPNENQSIAVNTYYVYDEYGNLTYVIPPLAAEKASLTATQIDELCYQYKYDKRNRLVERKLPGKGWEYMVYDKQDRLVATQDAEMFKTTFAFPSGTTGKAWAFTKYDAFGRVIYTGLYKGTETRTVLQDLLDTFGQNNEARSTTTFVQNGVTVYYTKTNAFPKNHSASTVDLLTVNYYDTNYTNLLPTGVTAPTSIEGEPLRNGTHSDKLQSLKGLPIASFVRIIPGADAWEKSYTFYDGKSRPLATYKYNHLGGYTKTESKIDFRGKPLYSTTYHKRLSTSTELKVKDNFTYDAQERPTNHVNTINDGIPERIAGNIYNEVGQLERKLVGNRASLPALQGINYTYNIRGWLTDINDITQTLQLRGAPGEPLDDIFAFHIDYDEFSNNGQAAGLPGLYNGNISQTLWKTASDNELRGYVYGYDELNRLREAAFHKPSASPTTFLGTYDEKIGYDINGNIKELKRNGGFENQSLPDAMDLLTYSYATDSNKLTKVLDDGFDGTGFIDGTNLGSDYTYDGNANMITDQNKGITNIKYNHLNLPVEIYWTATKKINYLYNAAGQKVQKTVTDGTSIHTTDYLDGFQYYGVTSSPAVLQFFPHAEGYVKQTTLSMLPTFDYVYNYTDHLGNIRLSYAKDPSTGDVKILEENHYYPFGLKHQKYTNPQPKDILANEDETTKAIGPGDPSTDIGPFKNYDYKYNGKEWQNELGLNMYDYGARLYDPALGRWMNVDPMAPKYFSHSPYAYTLNNPVYFVDPDGMQTESSSSGDSGGDTGGDGGPGGEGELAPGSEGTAENPIQLQTAVIVHKSKGSSSSSDSKSSNSSSAGGMFGLGGNSGSMFGNYHSAYNNIFSTPESTATYLKMRQAMYEGQLAVAIFYSSVVALPYMVAYGSVYAETKVGSYIIQTATKTSIDATMQYTVKGEVNWANAVVKSAVPGVKIGGSTIATGPIAGEVTDVTQKLIKGEDVNFTTSAAKVGVGYLGISVGKYAGAVATENGMSSAQSFIVEQGVKSFHNNVQSSIIVQGAKTE